VASSEQVATLHYAVRWPVITKRLGQLAVLLSVLTLAPLAVSFVFAEYRTVFRYLIVVTVLTAAGLRLSRRDAPTSIQANEALVITALAFILGPLIMTFPVMSGGLGFGDALFECISGVTTTGLSTLSAVESRAPSFLFARVWMQWYGGLGIVVLSVALMFGYNVTARQLVEAPATTENLDTATRLHARRTLVTYSALTFLAVTVLWMMGLPPLTAVTHAMAAVSTGGFSSFDASLAALPGWSLRFAVMAFAFLGAVALPLYYRVYRQGWRSIMGDEELRALVLASLIVSMLLVLFMHRPGGESRVAFVGHAVLMGVSAQTTTGFSSVPVASLDNASKLILIASMAVGGSVGSTAGGIKLLRLLLLLRMLQLVIRRAAMPRHAVVELRFGGRTVESAELVRTLLPVILFVVATLVSWLPFLALGYDPLNALFEVVSAIGTVGLSTGITSPELPALLKGVLCADMLLGRLEFVALLILLYPATWIGKRSGSS